MTPLDVRGRRRFLAFSAEAETEAVILRFRLTYEGRLEGNGSAQHKHEIRRTFHPQLKRLWQMQPNLAEWLRPNPQDKSYEIPAHASLGREYGRLGYNFVPLATEEMSLVSSINILFLRPEPPGCVIRSGDIDNRLKTLFDALRMPHSLQELGGYDTPAEDEQPFFVLLQDDKLISHVSVETDLLLEPTPSANKQNLANDSRLIITVDVRPFRVSINNLHFA